MPDPTPCYLPAHWQTRSTELRAKLADLAAMDTPESRWAANHVRHELALLDACLESVCETGPEYALCIGCGTATKDPDARLVAQRGLEADIELLGDGPDVREWPVLRRERTKHLYCNRFAVCVVCGELERLGD